MAQHLGQVLTPEVARHIALQIARGPDTPIDIGQFTPLIYKGYSIQPERFADILPELNVLHQRHYAETETYRAGIPLNPDYAEIMRRERIGQLLQFTAREISSGALVANMRVYLGRSLHTQTLFCTEDTFYVLPEHRGSFLAVRLWQCTERAAALLGVREVFFDSKTANRADRMARYLKYQAIGIKFAKVISPKE